METIKWMATRFLVCLGVCLGAGALLGLVFSAGYMYHAATVPGGGQVTEVEPQVDGDHEPAKVDQPKKKHLERRLMEWAWNKPWYVKWPLVIVVFVVLVFVGGGYLVLWRTR